MRVTTEESYRGEEGGGHSETPAKQLCGKEEVVNAKLKMWSAPF